MNKRIKIVLLIIAIIIVIAIIGIILLNEISKKNTNNVKWSNEFYKVDKNEINYKENTTVNELKEKMEMKADSNLYDITEEYDGRKTLNIKASVLYKVAFAGIIKKDKATFEEIDSIFEEKYPRNNGVWVSEQSREQFLKLISENTNTIYTIDEYGYLKTQENNKNEIDKKIENLINSDKTIIVDINSIDYDVDTVTGEIVEYPFQQLGDYVDVISNDNDKIIALSSDKKVNCNIILEEFINNL